MPDRSFQRIATIIESLGIIGLGANGLVVRAQRLFKTFLFIKNNAAIVERIGKIRSERYRPVVAGKRFVKLLDFLERIATVIVCGGKVGIDF